ncbi:MAG TPA: hypothetical protein VNK23_14825 [Candidatus Dormibacteraeota bacterium]|nr:hypothetical protein [Candidatus Dormibacteraeota bacterium]
MAAPVAEKRNGRQRQFPQLSICFSFALIREKRSFRGGTVNRPQQGVTPRKQKTGYMQGRNFPVQFLFTPAIIKKSQFSTASGSLWRASDSTSEDSYR